MLAIILPRPQSDPLETEHSHGGSADVMRPPSHGGRPSVHPNVRAARESVLDARAVEIAPDSDSPVLRRLTAAREQLQVLRRDYTDQHPEVKEQIQAVASLERSRAVGETLELAEARGKLAKLEVRYGPQHPELRAQVAVVESLEWSALVGERDQLAQAKAELARLRIDHGDAHPAVQSALARLADLER